MITYQEDVNVRKDTQVTLAQNCVQMEHSENHVPINVIVETTLFVMQSLANVSVNQVILVLIVRVDVFKEDSVQIVINSVLVRMEEFVILLLDRVFVLLVILERNVKLLVKPIDMDQHARKSATVRTAARVIV